MMRIARIFCLPPPVLVPALCNFYFYSAFIGTHLAATGKSVGIESQQDIAALTELMSKENCPPWLGSGPGAQRKGHSSCWQEV